MRFPVQGRTLVAVLMALPFAAAPLAPPSADASRWPGKRITYRDHSGMPKTVDEAARQWNRAVSGLRLVRARSGTRPMIRIVARAATSCGSTGCGAYPPGGLVELQRGFVRLQGRGPFDEPLNMMRVAIVAHEFGHALGLTHTSVSCDLMAPVLGLCRRRIPAGSGAARCGPQPRDARALARLYRIRARKIDGLCRMVPEPRAELPQPGPFVLTPAQPTEDTFGSIAPRVPVPIRNRSSRTWGIGKGRISVHFRLVDDTDARAAATCGQSAFSLSERTVAPGATGTILVAVCATGPVVLRLRPVATLADRAIDFEGADRHGPALAPISVAIDRPPTAHLSVDGIARVAEGWSVGLRADVADDGPARTTVDFGDGTTAPVDGPTVVHTYRAPGTYTVTLTVTDARGQVARATTTVVLEPDPPPDPEPPVEPPPEDPPPPADPPPPEDPAPPEP